MYKLQVVLVQNCFGGFKFFVTFGGVFALALSVPDFFYRIVYANNQT